MSWIKLRKELPQLPEVIRICAKLKIPTREAVGALALVFIWNDDNMGEGGVVNNCDLSMIDHIAGLPGIGDVLVEIGWLKAIGDKKVQWSNPDRHMSNRAKTRAAAAKRQAAKRDSKRDTRHADVTQPSREECDGQDQKALRDGLLDRQTDRQTDKTGECIHTPPLSPRSASARYLANGEPDIDAVWESIPPRRRKGKAKFLDEIRAIRDRGVDLQTVIDAYKRYYASGEGSGSFARLPATLLSDEFWSEPAEAWSVSEGGCENGHNVSPYRRKLMESAAAEEAADAAAREKQNDGP